MGWFGVESDTSCSDIALPDLIGTYEMVNDVKTYKAGSEGLTETEAKTFKFSVWSAAGAVWNWDLAYEFNLRLVAPQAIPFDTLECGQMYYINTILPHLAIDIPNFYPSALGVDMGRVVAA